MITPVKGRGLIDLHLKKMSGQKSRETDMYAPPMIATSDALRANPTMSVLAMLLRDLTAASSHRCFEGVTGLYTSAV